MTTRLSMCLISSIFLLLSIETQAWSNHTLITHGLLNSMPEIKNSKKVKVESLSTFLKATQPQLATFLEQEETWMQSNLWHYSALPEALAFKATGRYDDIQTRFIQAIRINPNADLNLYLQLLPGSHMPQLNKVEAHKVTTFENNQYLDDIELVELKEGDFTSVLEVISTASDEPDHGLDIGLFSDSNTEHGQIYGFGPQPFGNAKLEYGSQAPFHMGFYHEASIMYSVAGFLKKTYPEYRIHLYKRLSEFAFENGHPYWGWRFMGWGLHYIGDFSNPYHSTPVPGKSTAATIWVGLLKLMGFSEAQDATVQIVSNRHTAIEDFQGLVMKKAILEKNPEHITLKAISEPQVKKTFKSSDTIGVYAKEAFNKADWLDNIIIETMPEQYVQDSRVEYAKEPGRGKLIQTIHEHQGQAAVDKLNKTVASLLELFAANGKSFVLGILNKEAVTPE